jgi:hypothetical protein
MLVIIEGIDGSGKSTLCEQLSNKGYTIVRKSRTDKNLTFREFRFLQFAKEKYVIDRALLTPWAYRLLDNQQLDCDDFSFKEIITFLEDSPIIYCNCSNAFVYAIKRGEENIDSISKSNKLRQIYDFIIGTLELYNAATIFKYDFEKQTVDDVINFIKEVQ